VKHSARINRLEAKARKATEDTLRHALTMWPVYLDAYDDEQAAAAWDIMRHHYDALTSAWHNVLPDWRDNPINASTREITLSMVSLLYSKHLETWPDWVWLNL